VVRKDIVNKDEWPVVEDWDAVRHQWGLYVASAPNKLPTLGPQLKALGLAHGQSSTWRAQGGGGIRAVNHPSYDGIAVVVDKLSRPACVSVRVWLEMGAGSPPPARTAAPATPRSPAPARRRRWTPAPASTAAACGACGRPTRSRRRASAASAAPAWR